MGSALGALIFLQALAYLAQPSNNDDLQPESLKKGVTKALIPLCWGFRLVWWRYVGKEARPDESKVRPPKARRKGSGTSRSPQSTGHCRSLRAFVNWQEI